MKDLNQILLNPIRSRIIQYLSVQESATAKELATFIADVPRATLYRHLKILADSDVIMVVAENRVRGSVERTYSLNLTSLMEEDNKENATRNAFGFLMKIYADFERYFSEKKADPSKDKMFLSNVSLLLSDEEFEDLLKQINEILRNHLNNEPNQERKQRSLSFISSPSNDEESKRNETKK